MRLYHFSHYMLSTTAKGIQNTHSTVELFVKYRKDSAKMSKLLDYAKNHKTIISLDAGTSVELNELVEFLKCDGKKYPWAFFREDESLHEIITSISIVLPEKIYEMCSLIKEKRVTLANSYFQITSADEIKLINEKLDKWGNYSDFDIELIQRLCIHRLAS